MSDTQWWKQSQAPALLVRRDADRGVAWQANDAALLWAREHEYDDSELDRLATDIGALGEEHADGALGRTPTRHGELHWHAIPWANGWLAWCLPHRTFVPTSEEKLDRVEILRHFGRIGMVVGEPGTDTARWDANAYQLLGFDPQGPRPTPRDVLASVHPDDSRRVVDLLTFPTRAPGYANERFELRMRDGRVRHLHAMLNVLEVESGRGMQLAGVIVDDTETIERCLAQRKVAEDALSALELAGVGVWRQNLASGKVSGDAAFHARMQLPTNQLDIDHESVMRRHHPDDREAAREANARALQSTAAVDAVVRVSGSDSQAHRTLLTRRVAHRDASGRPVELVGVSMDISALVRVNEQAQAWARRAELAAAASGVGFWYLDPVTGEGEWDRTMFELHGRRPHLGAPLWNDWLEQYVKAEDRSALSAVQRLDVDAGTYRGRCRIGRADGGERWVEITLRPESRHEARRWVVMVVDITEKLASNSALRLEQQRARFAADAANLALWECSADGAPLYWSETMHALLGIRPALQHRSLEECWSCVRPASARHELERLIRFHAERRDTLEHEMQIQWPDDSVHWIALRARILPGLPGQEERMHGVGWDATSARIAELERRQTEAALADARAKESLTARFSRELRTTLTPLLGFSELAAASPDVPPQVRDLLAQVHVAGDALVQLLERLSSGEAPARPHEASRLLAQTGQVAPATSTGSPMLPLTVVCIEDNALNLLLVENLIATRRHITLKSAIDGRSGIEAVRQVRPDLVLVDLQLPDIDGLEVVRQIRADRLLKSTLCIALSASAMPSDIEQAIAAGFDDFWTKPIDMAHFLGSLDAIAQGQPLAQKAPQPMLD